LISLAGTLLLAASLSLLDVPYISQSEALCGGAAAAMVLRYWGASGVAAEDFAPLVDRSKAGIETTALARAIRDRGYDVRPASGTVELVQGELARGRPVIALIEDRPDAFHYVVVVGWHERAVVLHDPARTPYVLMRPAEFERRWAAADRWMLAVVPGEWPATADSVPPVRVPEDGAGSSCSALVAEGVRLAEQKDLTSAERVLTNAAYQCSGAAPLRELAGVRLLQRRWPEVGDLAGRAVEIDPADAHAWRLLATARYIGGDHRGALDAWNRVGEPAVDLVTVLGLQRTTHRSVERFLGIRSGRVLTRDRSDRATRRLDELPAAAMTRLEYLPRAAGTAEVRAHVVERNVVPRGMLTWVGIGLRAAASREISAAAASLARGGERLEGSWRFWPHRPAASIGLHVPGRPGVFSLELLWEHQPFTDTAVADARRLATQARLADWASGDVRWEGRGGYARWEEQGSFGMLGGSTRFERGRLRVGASVDVWLGASRFVLGSAQAGWRSSRDRQGFVLDLEGSLETIQREAPLDLWRAGDTGHARPTLLRAHPVLQEGRLRVDRLGRHLAQGTAETQHWWRPAGAIALGAAAFVDVARTSGRLAAGSLTDADVGGGIRLALPGRTGLFRVDIAHGLRDGRNALSVSWTPEH
jgi:hypothetical protein